MSIGIAEQKIKEFTEYADRCASIVESSLNGTRPLFGGDYNSYIVAVKAEVVDFLRKQVKFTISTEKPEAIVKLENASAVFAKGFFGVGNANFQLCYKSGSEITRDSIVKFLDKNDREISMRDGWSPGYTEDDIAREFINSAHTVTFQGSPETFVERINECLTKIGMPKIEQRQLAAATSHMIS